MVLDADSRIRRYPVMNPDLESVKALLVEADRFHTLSVATMEDYQMVGFLMREIRTIEEAIKFLISYENKLKDVRIVE
jgi:hypothetical protein